MSDARQQSRTSGTRAESTPDDENPCSIASFSFEWSLDTDRIVCSPECIPILRPGSDGRTGAWSDFLDHVPAPDRGELESLLAGLTPENPAYRTSYRYATPDGQELALEEHGWAEFGPSRRLVRRRGIVIDLTAQRQAAERLRRNEKRLHLALAAARAGTWSLDPATGSFIVSAEVRELLRLPADAPFTLQAFLGQIHPKDRPGVKARLDTAMRETSPFHAELRVLLPRGKIRWLAARAEPYAATDRDRRLLGVMQDISKRRSMEETLRAADRRKDEFLAMLAHELRNPLMPVRNAAELLRQIDPDDPRLRKVARMIERQTAHMERLVEDLADITRIATGRLELRRQTSSLADILAQALELARPRIEERRQDLDLRLFTNSAHLDCDPVRLCQVFSNLLDNAAKYTDEGGKISLQARVEATHAIIRVSDTGRGIAPEELSQLFDGLARNRPRPAPPLAGLGLGLSIVKRLVDLHGGKVSAKSPGIGQGSTFTVQLPLNPGPEPNERVAADRSQLRILVVDDDKDIAESTALLLQSLGHEVDLATGGEETLRRARERHYRLVLLDIGLGDSDGLEVARRLRQLPHGRDMRIAAVTGHGDAWTRREARAAGIDRHLLKPLSPHELSALLSSLPP